MLIWSTTEKFLKEGNKVSEMNSRILEIGLSTFMDKSREEMVKRDITYREKEKKLAEIEKAYISLELSIQVREIIDDYIAQIEDLESKYADISYMAGMRDTLVLLGNMGLLKINIG